MPSAADHVLAAIRAEGGSVPFRRFMELALYGEHGFYAAHGSAGRRGDFLTSPEVGPLFGAVVARALDAWWDELGQPADFTVIEAGAGPGTLARTIAAAQPRCAASWRYMTVEVSAVQRAKHPEWVESLAEMPDGQFTGVVFANELLDNLAFDLMVFDREWREAWVTAEDNRCTEVLRPSTLVSLPSYFPTTAQHGARLPLQRGAQEWLSTALGTLERGYVVAVDYCWPLTAMAAAHPWRQWLRTYVGHERGGHYLANPGGQDITTQVMIDQLATVRQPQNVRTQRQFLQLWGIDELVEEGKRAWEAAAARPDVAAMKMRSRVSEAEALLDPDGLGSFDVLTWKVDAVNAS